MEPQRDKHAGFLSSAATGARLQAIVSSSDDDACDDYVDGETEVDPRVKIELDILNQSASDVNCLEKEIDEARGKYQTTFTECTHQLETLKKKYGASIKRARPYFELKERAKQAQCEALRSARKFQSANSVYLAAKETISLAELRLMDDKTVSLSKAWQEMLNHAVLRVMEAETEKSLSEKEHSRRASIFAEMEKSLQELEKKNKRSILKARTYFETKQELEIKLQQVKLAVEDLQQAMKAAKQKYAAALRRLEHISNSIHEKRRRNLILMYPREPGVGAEESFQISEQKLPALFTDGDGSECYHDDYEQFKEDSDDNSIDNESVFRAKILSISLDEEDTSFMYNKHTKMARRRTLSLPLFPDLTNQTNDSLPSDKILAGEQEFCGKSVPYSDRADCSPPDGDSLSSDKDSNCESPYSQDCETTKTLADSSVKEVKNVNSESSSGSSQTEEFSEVALVVCKDALNTDLC
ncbi:SH3 domain-binding protein 5-like [Physella acuta]|uniref:SH3 domain-binding protein 5-like n=1 Tax=Physella acuta TaxID=109671 RepID=UPI0027DE851C|nr:SH3 domain-binding protein 5-like [Physella acuta]XP_059172776.1 SH3 domain-binding protein 5-like [Physella acuta]XP_059172777.1 SH3 domain-binding protein 5-like [Physella acuta]XP_059172778.1 SH3 domain-binding protein 5-like [Physella acuta]XP_059172779.1 SH3 domain-binding protein 5-like [Physella acuta]